MKAKIRFLDNEIRILSEKWPFILLIAAGILFTTTSILMLFGFIYSIYIVEKLLFSCGIIIFAIGLLCLLKQQNLIISINSSRGIFEIKNIYMLKKMATAFPIIHFSKIVIIERLSAIGRISKTSKHKICKTYKIALESKTKTILLLYEFLDKNKAFEFVHKLRELLLLDIYYQDKIYKKSDFKLKIASIPDKIQISEKSRIRKIQKESEIVLKWNSYYNFLSFLLLAAIIYGFYYINTFILIHENGLNLQNMVGYILSGAVSLIILLIFLIDYLKTKTIRLDRESLKYYINILGIKTGKKQLNWDDLYQIRNTLNAPELYIISKKGSELIQELMELPGKKQQVRFPDDTLAKLHALDKEQLKIDVSALPVSDRIRIEEEILNFML